VDIPDQPVLHAPGERCNSVGGDVGELYELIPTEHFDRIERRLDGYEHLLRIERAKVGVSKCLHWDSQLFSE
jgi:hypothetical protein